MSSDETVKQDTATEQPVGESASTEATTETVTPEAGPTSEASATDVGAAATAEPAAPSAETSAPAAGASAPAETSSADSSATPESDGQADTPAEATAAKKVQLKPTGGDDLKAVPTQDDISAAAAEMVVSPDGEVVQQAANAPKDAAIPVEIPPEPELGDIEAEIAAAMNSENEVAAKVENDPLSSELPETGSRKEGIVQSIHGDDVFVDLGCRLPGLLQLRQFEGQDAPEVGKKINVTVSKVDENEGLITVNLRGGRARPGGNWDEVEKDQVVSCTVSGSNKGGLEVQIGSLRGFLPAGQVDLQYVESLDSYIGQKLDVKITEVNPKKRNLVVSRRALLIEARKEMEAEFWEGLEVDQEFTGKVKTLKDYGAFVDLGGADGFLHIGQISWTHIKHPNEVLSEGQEINVKVQKIDAEKRKISLTMKGMMPNPWDSAANRYTPETVITGGVTKVTDFGAFIELEPGIEGLVHISELDYKRVRKVTDVCRVGQEVSAKVLEFDQNRKRVSLSIKQLKEDPRIAEEAAAEEELAKINANRIPREKLKGGIGKPSSSGGGLFGNPNDFS